jgi:hypothetical protein
MLRHRPELLREQPHCPGPGAALLTSAAAGKGGASGALDDLPTAHAAVAVAQAISAISLALDDPGFPAEIFR